MTLCFKNNDGIWNCVEGMTFSIDEDPLYCPGCGAYVNDFLLNQILDDLCTAILRHHKKHPNAYNDETGQELLTRAQELSHRPTTEGEQY